jgi:hypothetical protein
MAVNTALMGRGISLMHGTLYRRVLRSIGKFRRWTPEVTPSAAWRFRPAARPPAPLWKQVFAASRLPLPLPFLRIEEGTTGASGKVRGKTCGKSGGKGVENERKTLVAASD